MKMPSLSSSRLPFSLSLSLLASLSATGAHAENNDAYLQQYGADNVSATLQTGDGNIAAVTQYGVLNQSQVLQTGVSNEVSVIQSEEGYQHVSQIEQQGDTNLIDLQQHMGSGSYATLYQEGTGNVFLIDQQYYANSLDAAAVGTGNRLEVMQFSYGSGETRQEGAGNRIGLRQEVYGYGGGAVLHQSGDRNQLDMTQIGGRYYTGTVYFDQVGADNQGRVRHGGGFNTFEFVQQGDRNSADITQLGRSSELHGRSEGDDNQVTLAQDFDGGAIDLLQQGDANLASVVQEAYYANASITQIGDANQASISQTMSDFLSLGGDSATIIQQGNGNLANAVQQ
ncbi:hypothetical protein JQR85_12040 [Stutzerimonas urumqiensis]|uniref:hypothetical protein n=1 Tax=Stutzerimonas urumqiensis TaxID=638269 RepID=UPI003DA33ACF